MRATPDFDFDLTESAQMIRDAAARFADDKIAPLAARIDADGHRFQLHADRSRRATKSQRAVDLRHPR